MITQEYLNREIELARRIFIYYSDKTLDYLSIGSGKYIQWYKDSCSLLFLNRCLENLTIVDDELYLGGEATSIDYFLVTIEKVREYINNDLSGDLEVNYSYYGRGSDDTTSVVPAPSIIVYPNYNPIWVQQVVEVPSTGVSTVTLPFNLDDIDVNSLRLIVNDGDPVYFTSASEEGYHIIGNILYWHSFYTLEEGWNLEFRYLKVRQ